MSYNSDFQRQFIERSLDLVRTYSGEFDATNLINCLLGLLIIPHEVCFENIPTTSLSDFGIGADCVTEYGNGAKGMPRSAESYNTRLLVADLRHAIAHFHVTPLPHQGQVQEFEFKNVRSGFAAVLTIGQLRTLVSKMADALYALKDV